MSSEKIISAFEQNQLSDLLDAQKADKLGLLCKILLEYNRHVNLTAINDEDGVIIKHFADCAKLCALVPQNSRVLDVGCGGGFPSLVTAILRGDCAVIGMDSTEKKLEFVKTAISALKLDNMSVIHARAEESAVFPLCESFDVVCARAVAALPVLCELCIPYVKIGGKFIAMKSDSSEAPSSAGTVRILGGSKPEFTDYSLIDGEQTLLRTFISITKQSKTPTEYPRKYSAIKTKRL